MTETEADQRLENELNSILPDWRGSTGTTNEAGLRLIERDKENVFDLSLVNIPLDELPMFERALSAALGVHAGIVYI